MLRLAGRVKLYLLSLNNTAEPELLVSSRRLLESKHTVWRRNSTRMVALAGDLGSHSSCHEIRNADPTKKKEKKKEKRTKIHLLRIIDQKHRWCV